MNSQEEKALFEENGWTYDYIARRWLAPPDGPNARGDEVCIPTDDLVAWSDFGSIAKQMTETHIRMIVRYWGTKP